MGAEIVNNIINKFLFKGIKGGAQSISSLTGAMKGLAEQQAAVNSQTRKAGAEIAKGITLRVKEASVLKVSNQRHAEISKVMKATSLSANQAARAINQLGFTFDKSGRAIDALGKRMKLTKKIMTDMRKTTRRFNLGFLSLMFASMALNRAVGTFLRNAISAYDKASGETNNFRKETNKLTASWEFFKFSIIDALAQSGFFQSMVQTVTNLVNWFNRLTPATKGWIGVMLGAVFILTFFTMVLGQIGLAAGGIQVLGDMFRWFGTTAFLATLSVIGILLGLGIIIFAITKIIQTWGDDWFNTMEFIGVATIGLGVLVLGVTAKMALSYAAVGTASSTAAASSIIAWGLATGGILILIGIIIIAVTKIVKNWEEAKLAAIVFWNALRSSGVKAVASVRILIEKVVNSIKNFFSSIGIAIADTLSQIPLLGRAFRGVAASLKASKAASDAAFSERIRQIENEKRLKLRAIHAETRASIDATRQILAAKRTAEISTVATSSGQAGGFDFASAGLPSIEDFQAIKNQAPAPNNTSIGEVQINIDGAQADAAAIAEQVMEKLNDITNQGLDSSNI